MPGITGATLTGGRLNLVYDTRNQEFGPSKGFYGKVTAEYNRLLNEEERNSVEDYSRLLIDIRQYFSSVDQKLTVLLRNQWTFTNKRGLAFFEQATLGGPATLRAYDLGRFTGQHALFASVEMRYLVMDMVILGFPMVIEMGGFLDGGQVFEEDGFAGLFNLDPGFSVRMINRPNVGFIFNLAFGQDGNNLTGGITLPF